MQQLLSVWLTLDGQRRIVVAISTIAMFAAIIMLSRMATAPTMSLLYSGLEPGSAGEVVKALEQQSVAFEVRGNSIFVDGTRRDELRMTLAVDGVPNNSAQGYELLDGLSGFGTTAQMFDAAYWRAKEGELARTIVASPQFRSARVHISNTASRPFQRSQRPTASVTAIASGGSLGAAQAKGLKYLVASAVAGMKPEAVSIIDGRSGVVVSADENGAGAGAGGDRAAELKRNVERLLEARVGPGNVIVEVNVQTTNEHESITERTFDPDSRVAISTDTEERSTNSTDSRGSGVTVASNLPEGDAGSGDKSSSSQDTVTRERTNYEVSETTRELIRSPGAIRRISIAVLVDGVTETNPDTNTETWTARSTAELEALTELVASAVGFDAERGDVITLKSLQFKSVPSDGTLVTASFMQTMNLDAMRIVQLFVLSVVAMVLGLFVVRPILSAAPVSAVPALAPPGARNPIALPVDARPATGSGAAEPIQAMQALTGEIDDRDGSASDMQAFNAMPAALGGGDALSAPSDPVERLRQMIADRQGETVDILRNWIDEPEEKV